MPEVQNPEPTQNIPVDNTEDLKKSAYYTALYDAVMTTILEGDKSILTVSAGGVGLLVTLLALYQVKTPTDIIVYMIALGFFVISIVASIFIFKRNNVVLMNMLQGGAQKDTILAILDYLNISCCILGILTTIYIGLSTGIQKLNSKPAADADKTVKTLQINTVNGNVILQGYPNFTSIKGEKRNGK
jgi:hypothetical protein